MLVDALYMQGRDEEALELTELARAPTCPKTRRAGGWRRVRAKVLCPLGEFDEAERLGSEAVALAAGTDYLDVRAQAVADLAEVLRLAGRPEESAAALQEAIRLYEKKGNIAAAALLTGSPASASR